MSLFEYRSQSRKPYDGQSTEDTPPSRRPYNQTQRLFILRMARLLDMRRTNPEMPEEWQSKLLDRAIYSTYLDCLEQGVGDDARDLLHQQEAAKQS